jgi:hypothetical protein
MQKIFKYIFKNEAFFILENARKNIFVYFLYEIIEISDFFSSFRNGGETGKSDQRFGSQKNSLI